MDWGATVGTASSAGSLSFLRTVTLEISVFFTPSHVLRKETASLTLFTIPKVMEALVEGTGSTYSPTHSFQYGIISALAVLFTSPQGLTQTQWPKTDHWTRICNKTSTFLSKKQLGAQCLGYTGQSLSSPGEEEPPALFLWAVIPLKVLVFELLWKAIKLCWLPTMIYFMRTPHIKETQLIITF